LQLWEETDKSVAFPATAANDSGPEVRNDTETMKLPKATRQTTGCVTDEGCAKRPRKIHPTAAPDAFIST